MLAAVVTAFALPNGASAPSVLAPNPNTSAAGTLRDGVLSLELETQAGRWPTNGGTAPSSLVNAFAERGKAATLPAPLIRVPVGTLVRVRIHNTLREQITFFLPTSPATDDSVVLAPGTTGDLAVRAATPGSFIYRATTGAKMSQRIRVDGAMAGAMVVDTAGAPRTPRDRVMVLLQTPDSLLSAEMEAGKTLATARGWYTFTINGKAWPSTDRITGTVGDSLRWRVINATFDVHPMHLHGFYFRVDEYSGLGGNRENNAAPGTMVVTQRMGAFSAMSMTWVPERPGNWLFHCHFALHLAPDAAALPEAESHGRPAHAMHEENHALTGMVGLAVALNVAPRRGARAAIDSAPARTLRLIAVADSGFPPMRPSMRFVIEENGQRTASAPGFSPTLYLRRNERVSITVVNELREPTAVHWHGMELESYFDGVAGLSGAGLRLAPTVAPRDSFVARFTPPRSGTFMYHSHMDDVRQQPAGLVGAMIVSDAPLTAARDNPDDHLIFLKGARSGPIGNNPLEIGGRGPADTIVLHAGRPARFRFMSLSAVNPSATITLTARPDSAFRNLSDTMVVRWTPVAKDGYDLRQHTPREARQVISMGETYDFEFTPTRRGEQLRIEVRGAAATQSLLARVPVKVVE